MSFETLGIPIAFTLLAACLLWFVIGAKGWWWIKMICIFVTLYCGIAMWQATSTYLGWPTKNKLPDLYMVHWAVVDEPNKTIANDDGAIYLWLRDIDKNPEKSDNWLSVPFLEYKADKKEPRSYELPYSKELHQAVQAMKRGIKKGKTYIGGKKANGGKGKGKGKGKNKGKGRGQPGTGKGKGNSQSLYNYTTPQIPQFYELPPPAIPQKNPGI